MANILMIETSTKACSVALSHDFNIEFNRETFEGPNHATVLGEYVREAMDFSRENHLDIDAVAVSSGPGSYTGLRIGVSEAKGICFGLNVPLISIPTLQIMCCRVMFGSELPEGALYCPMIDARRMEVYTALYDQALQVVSPVEAKIIDSGSFHDILEEHPIYFFGDGADKCAEVIKHPNAHFIPNIRALAMDMLAPAVRAFSRSQFEDVAYFTPFYLKDFVASKPKNLLEGL